MTLQRTISRERNESLVGEPIEVLVEAPAQDGEPARGRTWMDAPEIDGGVTLTGRPVAPGDIVTARVTAAAAYDLEAVRAPAETDAVRGCKNPTNSAE